MLVPYSSPAKQLLLPLNLWLNGIYGCLIWDFKLIWSKVRHAWFMKIFFVFYFDKFFPTKNSMNYLLLFSRKASIASLPLDSERVFLVCNECLERVFFPHNITGNIYSVAYWLAIFNNVSSSKLICCLLSL